ncbi:DUF885 domain-containing protein [Solimonas terrae]|uniref:DUF885 domain-containing protein n=1 Tax=Solimonas terrae TaxID=1396819 RepID=A0A6M2BVV0_9GAMM|nr:DUF885 domain-containing protein [Solimonas terrae]NGY06087.1 DUF885 domain-containing protein [Solimonas terrae]
MNRFHLLARGAAVALSLASGLAHADANSAFQQQFGDAFLDRYWSLHDDYAITVGYYRHADRLTAPDARYRAKLQAFLDESIGKLEKLPGAQMSDALRTDREMLLNQLRYERWSLDELRDWQWVPSGYNVADAFSLLLNTPYADEAVRLRTVSRRLTQVPAYYAAAERAISHPTRVHTQLAIEQNQGALDVFGDALEKQVAGSQLTADERVLFLHRLKAARAAIDGYVAFLKQLDARQAKDGGARDFRLGQPYYDQAFAFEVQTGGTAAQLYQRALQEKDKLHARMSVLADQLWPKYFPDVPAPADPVTKIGQLIEKLSDNHVTPAEFYPQTKALIPRLEAWVTDHDLLTLDPSRPLEVRVTPPYQRGYAMAMLAAPGPYDPTARTFFDVMPMDDYSPAQADSFLREYNHWLMQILAIHEAVPGHYVQLLYANKSPSRIKAIFGNSAMIEGWAVYSERMMLESGWPGGAAAHEPEMELMYSKWALRVVCNTILDYGVHVLGMSEDDAMNLLVHDAFQSQTEARGKWRRVQLSSVQLTFYFAGFSAIYDYRERLKTELGPRFDLKKFHEKFLSYGSAPVSIIESLMKPEDVAR